MKKLKLSELNFDNAEVLTREQLKKVLGGDGSGGDGGFIGWQCCWINYPEDCSPCTTSPGYCMPGTFLDKC